jgi:hypothetical protein
VYEYRDGYQETLWAPVSWWALGAGAVAAVWWCFYVATPVRVAWVAVVVAAVAVVGGLVRYGGARVSTDSAGLHAGRAVLPWPCVGAVEVLDADSARDLLGVHADARAYLLVRTYCRGAVKIAVNDDRDPTPYWVVSTRHADELAGHLRPGGVRRGAQHT